MKSPWGWPVPEAPPSPCGQLLSATGDSRWLSIALVVGLSGLAVALILLMRTRWGNARTVTKCVWLSILAHVLLGGLAYGTKLFFPPPPPADSFAMVNIQLIVDPAESETLPADAADEPAEAEPQEDPPEEFTAPQLAMVPTEPPSPPDEQQDEDELPGDPPIDESPETAETETLAIDAEPFEQDSAPEIVPDVEPEIAEELWDESLDAEAPKADAITEPPPMTLADALQSQQATPTEMMLNASPLEPVERLAPNDDSAPIFAKPSPRHALPVVYSLRNTENRLQAAIVRGGSRESELAVDEALRWLAQRQDPNGHWDAAASGAGREAYVLGHDRQGAGRDADTALTGLALLVFLGAGETSQSGDYRDVVARGLNYLVQNQDPSGHLAGRASLFAHMYSHGIATLAVSEALALTGDPALRPCVEAAVGYSIRCQDPQTGSWRYRPREPGDMSQFGWQIMALKSAELSGIQLPRETIDRADRFIDRCSSGVHGGLGSYRPGQPPSETMTAESLVCRCFLRQVVPPQVSDEATRFIAAAAPRDGGEVNYYLWYYGTLAMHQTGGERWPAWNEAVQRQLLRTQITQGNQRGSWPADGKWSAYGGPIYSTAMAALCLEVYYRYLPIANIRTASR